MHAPCLLITDDDRDFRETLRGVFEPRGFRALVAQDGQEAVDIVRRDEVHLLLVDMHMPRLTGLEMVRHLRDLPRSIPFILMSAALDTAIEEEARKADAFSILAKPFPLRRITNLVTDAMRQFYNWPNV